ncbi:TonB family protein [Pedobacter nutrimenti]|uniref:TonB family protein n=1 Tax=Pedobacter nutrimenti TaxID=1241337 RepID=UPI00292CDC47|nr:TonB family protein [Pedobacter nutrimenti]
MKKLMLSIILISLFTAVRAQRQNVYFLKNNGKEMKERDSADFIRIIQEPDSGDVNFKLLEYYPDGKKKTIGYTSTVMPLKFEGPYISYSKSGKKVSSVNYNRGWLAGPAYYFFDSGILQKQVDYSGEPIRPAFPNQTSLPFGNEEKLVYLADSVGNVMVKDGNGHVFLREYKKNGEVLTEEGDYKDGLKQGEWRMTSSSGNYWYKEQFELGKMLHGESFKDGVGYKYTVGEKQPEYQGGMEIFYNKYLVNELRYPNDAANAKITGRVFLSFTIEEDGAITGLTVDRSVHPSLDREAMRVILKSSKWVPGLHHGIPTSMRLNIPFSFSLP